MVRFQKPSPNSATAPKTFLTMTCKNERFVVLMYDRSSGSSGVDEARLALCARRHRSYDTIPSTHAALKEHEKRAAYQAGIIQQCPILISPLLLTGFGFRKTTHDRSVGRHVCQLLRAVRTPSKVAFRAVNLSHFSTFLLYLQTAAPVFVPFRLNNS